MAVKAIEFQNLGPESEDWDRLWGRPKGRLRELADLSAEVARGVFAADWRATFGDTVSSSENDSQPVHRWYPYKEAFSFRLPQMLLTQLGAGSTRRVVDPFMGVGTTPLSLQNHPVLLEVGGIEYSPFAHFVASTKLSWSSIDAARLQRLAEGLLSYEALDTAPPALAAFNNREIFSKSVLASLMGARARIERMGCTEIERNYLKLALATVIEPVSGAMKDGRALRILRGRKRSRNRIAEAKDPVRSALQTQLSRMVQDLEQMHRLNHPAGQRVSTWVARGDARTLSWMSEPRDRRLEDQSVGLFLYSPPYLNCIDYSEVYKLELWMLQLVRTQDEFKALRLGTLRSHPSVTFPKRHILDADRNQVPVRLIAGMADFVAHNSTRPEVGPTIWNYFEDMYCALAEQLRCLEPGGHVACVVGNSTFSRRELGACGPREEWRLPVLTDVLLASLGQVLGFETSEVWVARDLRPRNVAAATSRESIVVLRKPQ